MTTCRGAFVGVEDVLVKHRGDEGFGVPVTETDERRNALGGERPVDPAVGNDLLRCRHVGACLGDGFCETFCVKPVGKERSRVRDGGTLGGLPAIAIERRVGAIGGATGVGPREGQTTELDVLLHMTNA